jgi:hypothetical protein
MGKNDSSPEKDVRNIKAGWVERNHGGDTLDIRQPQAEYVQRRAPAFVLGDPFGQYDQQRRVSGPQFDVGDSRPDGDLICPQSYPQNALPFLLSRIYFDVTGAGQL